MNFHEIMEINKLIEIMDQISGLLEIMAHFREIIEEKKIVKIIIFR